MNEPDNLSTDVPPPAEPDQINDHQVSVQIGKTILPAVSAALPPYLTNPHVKLSENSEESFQVWLAAQCLASMAAHTATTPLEAGGVVIGQTFFWKDHYHIQVEAAIAATQAEADWAGLRFTLAAWEEMLAMRERHFPNRVIVGWYHSHPLMDVGMSDWDITLHDGFFREPWQLSLITDPYLGILGIFRTERSLPLQVTTLSISELITKIDHQPIKIGCYKNYILYTPRPHPLYGLIPVGHLQSLLDNFPSKGEGK